MRLGKDGSSPGADRLPRLAPGCNPASLTLTPSEGYLLSRIDGMTPVSLLRQMGALPPADVDRCIARWEKEGVIVFAGRGSDMARPAPPPPPPAVAKAPKPAKAPSADIDPSLDLSVEMQERVLEFESRLALPYHELLGVARDADVRAIKSAYFGLSKQFHPDRYFRRNLGPYALRVENIFKKVLEAYELLSDPATRAEVQSQPAPAPAPPAAPAAAAAAAGSDAAGAQAASDAAAAARRLRQRLHSLGRNNKVLGERKRKAKTFFESGMAAFKKERWLEAAGSIRLALAFDPDNEVFKSEFAAVQRKAHEERARVLLKEADGCYELGDYKEALRAYEDALHYRPFDAELAFKTARLSWKLGGDLRKAKEYAMAACELAPEHAAYHRVLGQIYKAAGLAANAKRELQHALRLDSSDAEAKQELKSL
jgi:curved DNA-binding protein CbpA